MKIIISLLLLTICLGCSKLEVKKSERCLKDGEWKISSLIVGENELVGTGYCDYVFTFSKDRKVIAQIKTLGVAELGEWRDVKVDGKWHFVIDMGEIMPLLNKEWKTDEVHKSLIDYSTEDEKGVKYKLQFKKIHTP